MAKFRVIKLRNGGVKLLQDGVEIKDITNLEVRHHTIPGRTMLTNINIQITSNDVEVVNEPENSQKEVVFAVNAGDKIGRIMHEMKEREGRAPIIV